jgi:hypothetical protein
VHANLHSLHGGAWNCAHDFAALVESDPEKYPSKVMDWLAVNSFNIWFQQMFQYGGFKCVEKTDADFPCAIGDGECGNVYDVVDFAAMNAVELWGFYGNKMMAYLASSFRG